MDSERLEQFKQQLEAMKQAIINDVEQTLAEMTSQPGNIPDPNDRATFESDRNFELRIRGREQKLMSKIDEAIARIDEGEYGICLDCGDDITIKRLEARPVATFCIECKTRQEQKEKAQGR